jgi:hypothetical protein
MLNKVRKVVADAADRVRLELKVENLATSLETLRKGADRAIGSVGKRVDALERIAQHDQALLASFATRLDLLAEPGVVIEEGTAESVAVAALEKELRVLANEYDRLRSFLMKRYPERYAEQSQVFATVVDVAILLLTPGDGSEEAWKRMRTASGYDGPQAQRELVARAHAEIHDEAPAAVPAPEKEPELGQCRTNADGDVIRIDAETPDGTFVPVGIIGKSPTVAGWPMKSAAICADWPIVLAAPVFAGPGPRVGFGG